MGQVLTYYHPIKMFVAVVPVENTLINSPGSIWPLARLVNVTDAVCPFGTATTVPPVPIYKQRVGELKVAESLGVTEAQNLGGAVNAVMEIPFQN
jgi:hypothetical protein